jgi:hypothetical protein
MRSAGPSRFEKLPRSATISFTLLLVNLFSFAILSTLIHAASPPPGPCEGKPVGTLCRAAAGPCDKPEYCDPRSFGSLCPPDELQPSSYVCRTPAGPCDVAEYCTGSSPACPADIVRPSSYVCRKPVGPCDVAEHCTGVEAQCPADTFSAGNECRAKAGPCDWPEYCTGLGPLCPSDVFLPSGQVCRAAANDCDAAEICTGAGSACPADAYIPGSYTLSTSSASFDSSMNGGMVEFRTLGWCGNPYSIDVSWIHVTGQLLAFGRGSISYVVDANATGNPRTGTITIADQTFTVTQGGVTTCAYAISPTEANFDSSANTGEVTVTTASGCPWTAVGSEPWITIIAGSSGTGNGTVSYSVSSNTGAFRIGTITVAGKTFSVVQEGPCVRTISPPSALFGAMGGDGTVTITSSDGCLPWTYWANDSWITTSLATGDTIPYSVSVNTSGATRIGTIGIAGQTFTVIQEGDAGCVRTLSPTSAVFSAMGGAGTVTITSSDGCLPWASGSNDSWITQSESVGDTIPYSVSPNTTGATRVGTMVIGGLIFTVAQTGTQSTTVSLYFPHVDTNLPWQTEIAVINTGDQPLAGTLRALSNGGQLVDSKVIILPSYGRAQVTVADEFGNHTSIRHIIVDADSDTVQGYTKFYRAGTYRAAVPAVKEVNTSDIYISHIASNADWWTGVSLVNITSEKIELTMTFSNGQTRNITLNANEHKAFSIRSLFNDQPQPDIESAVITHASGVIGLELFGSSGWGTQLEGILLTDKTISTLYYPHVASDDYWWTGIVAYNPSASTCTITITPYSTQGTALPSSTFPIAGKGKYIGAVANLGLPAQTAWFKIDSTRPLSGLELFGTVNGNQLAAYAGGGRTAAKTGVFPKIEKNGWTGIAFVNTEANAASVILTAYNDNGAAVATVALPVAGHAKVVKPAEDIFTHDISDATYIAYSSDRNVVGFQLNGSSDGTMLDGLPGF